MKPAWKPVAVAFALGVVLGGALGIWSAPGLMHRRWSRGAFHERMLQEFSSKLKLDSGQKEKVAAILEGKRNKVDALRLEMRPRFEEIRKATHAEIRQLLSAEQQPLLDEMEAEWEKRAKRRHDRRMPEPGGP